MDRRFFLAGASGAVASLPFTTSAHARGNRSNDIRLTRSYVTNREQFHDAVLPKDDDVLQLNRKPERSFDPASIAVMTLNGEQLGYLPAASSGMLAALIDGGFSAYGIVVAPEGERQGVFMDIYLGENVA